MRVIDPMPILGLPSGLLELRLTQREQDALALAGTILTEIRDKCEAHEGEDNDARTDIALAAYTCAELANEGRIFL